MDRNVVIATVLIAIIMVVWLKWMAPPPRANTEAIPSGVDSSEVEVVPDTAAEAEVQAPGQAPVFAESDSIFVGTQEGVVREIVVETDLYTAVFSTKGATLTSFRLKEYTKSNSEEAVQLVDTTKGGAIGLVFTSQGNRVFDSRSFVFESGAADDIVVGDAPSEIAFRTAAGDGAITKRYTFTNGSYEVNLSVEFESPESFMAQGDYEIVWNGGLPFSEGDHQNETQLSGAYARSGGEVESAVLTSEAYDETSLRGSVDWVAVKNKYFMAAILPSGDARGAELFGERFGEVTDPSVRLDFVASLEVPITVAPSYDYRIYLGPMEFKRIHEYALGLYDTVDYGWDFFEAVTRPLAKFVFIPAFALLSSFIPNYGLVIIIFSILIKLVLAPLTKKSFRSMAKMRELQPRMEAIKEKYADNPQKQQQATMKLYKETGVNPLGGCLPMLLQYPIIIALWQFLPQAIEIRQQGFLWANDLSAPDVILNLPFTLPMYGNFVAGFTLLMGISMVVQMKIQATPGTGAQQKIFTYVFPIMIFVIFNRLASGLNLYYLCYNVFTAVQQKIINTQLHKEAVEAGGVIPDDKHEKPDKGKKPRKSLVTNGQADARPAKKNRR